MTKIKVFEMKASEFRIGNLVYNQTTMKVMEVYPMMIPQLAKIDGVSNIKPIELTEEWLLNFGFEKLGLAFVLNDSIIIWEQDGEFLFYLKSHNGTEIKSYQKFVHSIQNLVFALTQKELPLK